MQRRFFDRFGKVFTHLTCYNITSLQAEEIRPIYNENTGHKNERACSVGENHIIKFSANPGKIRTELDVTERLKRAGLPVAEAVKSTDGSICVPQGELYFYVTKRLDGQPLRCDTLLLPDALKRVWMSSH